MITYDWNCKTVDVIPTKDGLTNVIFQVHWIVTGTSDDDEPITSTMIGVESLDTDNITDFTSFEDITNEQVTAWVINKMGDEKVSMIKETINKNIEEIKNPSSITMTIAY